MRSGDAGKKATTTEFFSCSPPCGPLLTFYGPKYVRGSSSMAFNGARLRVSQHLDLRHIYHVRRGGRLSMAINWRVKTASASLCKKLFSPPLSARRSTQLLVPPAIFLQRKRGSELQKLQGGMFFCERHKNASTFEVRGVGSHLKEASILQQRPWGIQL